MTGATEHASAIAREGLRRAIADLDPDDLLTAQIRVAQALFWACAIDEQGWSSAEYLTRRGSDPVGRLMPGYRFARNAVTHGALICVQVRTGLTWPVTSPVRWTGLDWVGIETVLAASQRGKDRGSREYADGIAGRSVFDTLPDLYTFFDRVAASA